MYTRVNRWGNSLGLRLPQAIASHLDLRDGSEVRLRLKESSIIVQPVSAVRGLDDLLADISPDNARAESDWGSSRFLNVR